MASFNSLVSLSSSGNFEIGSKDSQDVVRLGAGIREQMRSTIGPLADRLWQEQKASAAGRFEANAADEKVYLDIQALSPQNDLQRSLQARAAQISTDIAQTRLMLFVESDNYTGAVSGDSGFLACYHIRKLQPVLRAERDGFRFSIPVRTIGVVRTVSNIGTERAIHRFHNDIKRTAAECAGTFVTPQELKSAATATDRGRECRFVRFGLTADMVS